MRYGVKPIIVVINNSGYTIERALCKNPMDIFNNIASWNYSKLPQVFNGKSWTKRVETEQEFHDALKQAGIEQKDKLCYIEICTDKMDMPKLAKDLISRSLAKV
jgi:indolepyruvate decarboxylase